MKGKLNLFVLCLFVLLFIPFIYAVDYGYPFYGRFVYSDDVAASNISLYYDFGDCRGRDLVTNSNGEFVLVMNDESDIFNKETGLACSAKVSVGDEYYIVIKSIQDCGENLSYGPFFVETSISPIGTHMVDSCLLKQYDDYIPNSGSSGGSSGGSGSGSSGLNVNDRVLVLPIDDAQDIMKDYEEQKQEDRSSNFNNNTGNKSQGYSEIDFSAESKTPYLQEVKMNVSDQTMYSLLMFAIIILIANMSAMYSYFKALIDKKSLKPKNSKKSKKNNSKIKK